MAACACVCQLRRSHADARRADAQRADAQRADAQRADAQRVAAVIVRALLSPLASPSTWARVLYAVATCACVRARCCCVLWRRRPTASRETAPWRVVNNDRSDGTAERTTLCVGCARPCRARGARAADRRAHARRALPRGEHAVDRQWTGAHARRVEGTEGESDREQTAAADGR